ncbi:cadherin EGF LAG seven-pass G-type receptor fmi-1-like [Haliotis rufescens]|uniref:cadherin EGF LAG seven-pass G-type receptor fmi-1-like n=1 Tax=Haliotis rufescens TaxID=6454 RepID=UPI00201F1275|nr:cadherin EGF LAG seven-pass G-type receptor fmi-1-like [Haliotis rufescens]
MLFISCNESSASMTALKEVHQMMLLACVVLWICIQGNNGASSTTTPSPILMTDFQVTNIHEDKQIEEDIATVGCSDSVSGDGTCPVCNIKSMFPQGGPFRVWRKYGNQDFHVYYVGGAATDGLDYNVARTYNITIECTSADETTTVTKILEVDVQPNQPPFVFDNPGVTLSYDAQVNTGVGWTVYDINVRDNESDPITYIWSTEPVVDYFDIGQSDGIIQVVKDLRTAVVDVVAIKVNVSDGHNVVGPFTVSVQLTNLNSRPVFTNLPTNVSVYEDLSGGSTIYTLSYVDYDLYSTLTPVCSVTPDNENYKFVYLTGAKRIQLASLTTEGNLLDFETTTYYNISCLINDGYLDSVGGYINLFVLNVNEPPEFNDRVYYCIMNENYQNVGACDLSGLTVSDPEGNSIIDYRLLTGNNSERFQYDNAKKQLAFNVDYDVDAAAMPTSVRLTLAAVDDQSATGTAQIQINVIDVNDNAPSFATSVNAYSVTQGQAVGAIGRITATDADLTSPNNDVTFTVTGGSFSNYVSVLGNGQVIYANEFDTSFSGKSELVYVEAKDGGSPAKSTTATVIVSFQTTTSTTTTTTTTSTPTTTPTTTTTTPKPGFFDYTENIVLFCFLMFLLLLLVLAALYLLYRYCYMPSGPAGAGKGTSLCESLSGEGGGCDDCFRPSQANRVQNQPRNDYPMRQQPPRINGDYKDPFWKSDDHYENGAIARIF